MEFLLSTQFLLLFLVAFSILYSVQRAWAAHCARQEEILETLRRIAESNEDLCRIVGLNALEIKDAIEAVR
jgi:hypothetical protein